MGSMQGFGAGSMFMPAFSTTVTTQGCIRVNTDTQKAEWRQNWRYFYFSMWRKGESVGAEVSV